MAVRKKGLRKVNYKNQQYLWRVDEVNREIPEVGFVVHKRTARYLHVISSNKRFIIHYRQPEAGEETALLEVEGELFPRQPGATAVPVPRWRHDTKRYPTADFVRRLIHWCMTPAKKDT